MPSSAFTLCASFNLFPDNTVLGPSFQLSGFSFREFGPPTLFVNDTNGTLALQFPQQGMAVGLPVPVSAVDLRVGAFAGDFTIDAKDLAGNIGTLVVPGTNSYLDVRVIGRDIATLEFTGGHEEGALVQICIALAVG